MTNLKCNIPKFHGTSDPEAYLSWALKVDKIFRVQNFSEQKKVALASLEFEDYALLWWEQLQNHREDNQEDPIDTWKDMKEEMHARFVPQHYTRDLFNRLQQLKQGLKSVDEYYKEMETAMMRTNIEESEEQSMARFMNGLNYPIKKIVEFQPYNNLVELVHQATKAERQVIDDLKYIKSKTFFSNKASSSSTQVAPPPQASNAKGTSKASPSTIKSPPTFKKTTTTTTPTNGKSSLVHCYKCGGQGHKSFE